MIKIDEQAARQILLIIAAEMKRIAESPTTLLPQTKQQAEALKAISDEIIAQLEWSSK